MRAARRGIAAAPSDGKTGSPTGAGGELRGLLVLAGPLALAQVGHMMIGVVGTALAGRIDEVALGAVGLGNSLFFAVAVLGMGVMLGLDPLAAQAIGAGEVRRARRVFWQGVWLSLGLTVPLGGVMIAITQLLPAFGVDPETADLTSRYLLTRLLALWPFLLGAAARSYLQALDITQPLLVGVLVANVLNVLAGYALVFGDAGLGRIGLASIGLPALGVMGVGYANATATALITVFMLLRVAALGPEVPEADDPSDARPLRAPDRELSMRALRLGTPLGLQLLAEVGAFTLVTILMGRIGNRALAAHQVALTLASVTFNVTIAIGAAAAVRVGRAIGRQDGPGTRRAGVIALVTGGTFMLGAALLFWLAPEALAGLLTDEPEVISAAVPLLLVAAAFQIGDGLQAVGAGALRGAGDTRVSMIANVLGHYACGLPVGLVLAFGVGLGAVGLWWGLTAGLSAVAVALILRFWRISSREIARS